MVNSVVHLYVGITGKHICNQCNVSLLFETTYANVLEALTTVCETLICFGCHVWVGKGILYAPHQ